MKFGKPHKLKRILSCLSALVITTSLAGVLPAYADDEITPYPYTIFAGSNEEGAISSTAATLCINGNIATNGTLSIGSNVNVNGTKTEHAQEAMPIIFNQIDDRFFSENNEMHDEDYSFSDTNICVIIPVEVQGQLAYDGNIAISAGIKALNDITLTGEVLNTNNSVICSQTGDITIDSTNVSLNGLYYAPYGTVSLKAQNLNLNNVVIIADKINIDAQNVNVNYNLSMAKFVGEAIELSNNVHVSNDDIDPFIYAFGAYNKENNSIDISWYTNIPGEFEILESDNNESFVSLDLISDTTTFVYNISNDFDTKYFKVKGISGSKTAESIPFVVKKVEDHYSIDYLDSDKDGLYDIYECFLGTDINDSDTDNDGLTDYQEFFMTGTDPTIYDSVIEGVSDYYIDSDDDGIINGREIEIGTEPQNPDSDYDELSDGDEVNSYGTDPLNTDSDGDSLSDGDEPYIGLDPANPRTFGTPDEEYVTEQIISAQSDAFSKINTDENPYELSMKYTGTGYAESNITVEKSGYANAIESNMELGAIAEFSFENSCKMEKAVLYYSIKNDYIDNELGKYALNNEELVGIKRLGVFTYNEENHILVPLVTEYDVENNTVYAEVNAAGTYFLVDYEKWFDEWGISAETSSNPTRLMAKASTVNEVSTKNVRIDKADIVFSVDISGTSSNKLGETPEQNLARAKNDILTVAEKTFERGEGVRFGVFGFTGRYSVSEIGYRTYLDNGSEWATNLEELEYLLNQLYIDPYYQRAYIECGIQDAASPIATKIQQYQYRNDADKYLFEYAPLGDLNFFDGSYVLSELCSYPALYDQLERSEIRFSYVLDKVAYYSIFEQAAYQTGGQTAFYCLDSVTDDISDFIYGTAKKVEITNEDDLSSTYISSLSLKSITLATPLVVNGETKSDEDGLTDWEEVFSYSNLISDEAGKISLPSYRDCLEACSGTVFNYNTAWNDMEKRFGFSTALNMVEKKILPLDSNPTTNDTDKDGLLDSFDPKPTTDYNNGDVLFGFTDETFNQFTDYDIYIQKMEDIYTNTGKSSEMSFNDFLDFYSNLYNMEIDSTTGQRIEMIKNYNSLLVTCLQRCLVYIGYLKEEYVIESYGKLNSRTIAAYQLFQLNYGFNISYAKKTSKYTYCNIDEISYLTLLNVAINHGFSFTENSINYNQLLDFIGMTEFISHKKQFDYIPSKPKKLSEELSSKKVSYNSIEGVFDNVYYFDYSEIIKNVLKENEQAFFDHDSGDLFDYLWFYFQVKSRGPWDIKLKEEWDKMFPVKQYSMFFQFFFECNSFSGIFTAENLGNLTYGYLGTCSNYTYEILLAGGDFAAGGEDSHEDKLMIRLGVLLYCEYNKDYSRIPFSGGDENA